MKEVGDVQASGARSHSRAERLCALCYASSSHAVPTLSSDR